MEAIGHVLPIALAVAISAVPIMATIIILLSPNRPKLAIPFLIGWMLGILVVVTVFTLAAQAVPTSRTPRQPDVIVGGIEIVVGVAMILLALYSWRRAKGRPSPEVPKWLASSGSLRPWESFGLAFVLNLRPKGLLLATAAGLTIRADAETTGAAIVAIAVYTLVGASTVVVPIIATLAAPERMQPRLVAAREWLTANGGALTSLILLFIGVVVTGMGIARL